MLLPMVTSSKALLKPETIVNYASTEAKINFNAFTHPVRLHSDAHLLQQESNQGCKDTDVLLDYSFTSIRTT